MSPGAPPNPPRARDLFLSPFFDVCCSKIDSKMEQTSIQKVCLFCLLFRYRFSLIFERKVITFGVLLKLILMIFATFEKHENDAPVYARASFWGARAFKNYQKTRSLIQLLRNNRRDCPLPAFHSDDNMIWKLFLHMSHFCGEDP